MRVQIALDAANRYHRRCYEGKSPACHDLHDPRIEDLLQKIQGQWLPVDTRYLFKDRFSLLPIPGLTRHGLNVMESYISGIQNDRRHGKIACGWCYSHQPIERDVVCGSCGKTGHLSPLIHEGAKLDETCNRDGCKGTIHLWPIGDCSCHTGNPPCSRCSDPVACCDTCGWEAE